MVRVSGKEMCEAIAQHWQAEHPARLNRFPTPQAIWESSPTGELVQVYEWYHEAVEHARLSALEDSNSADSFDVK